MRTIFVWVYTLLKQASSVTGLTYNEVNIIVYYVILPMVFFMLIDKILNKHILKIVYSVIVFITLVAVDFERLSDWLFDASARFLLSFQIFGWNYVVASVIICVVVPFIVFDVLFYYAYWPIVGNLLNRIRDNSR